MGNPTTPSKNDSINVRASAIVLEQDRVLFLRYSYPRGTVFCFPGGGLHVGETLAAALRRELREELSIDVEVDQLAYLGDMLATPHYPQTVHVVFRARIVGGRPVLNPQFTTAREAVWLPIDGLAGKNLYPAINAALIADLSVGEIQSRYLGDCLQRSWM